MQYEETETGSREMDIKVVDMGSGWERQAWAVSEQPNVYEIAFKPITDYLKKQTGAKVDKKLFLEYSKIAGSLNADETDLVKARAGIAKQLGVDKGELFKEIAPLEAVYAIADHSKALLFAVTDGQLPSNSGGGYNLRLIARRALGFVQEYGFDFDFEKVLELHADFLSPVYSGLDEGVDTTAIVIEEERKKYLETMRRGRGKVVSLLKKTKGKISQDKLLELYESDGVPIEMIEEVATEEKLSVEIPPDFYMKVAEKHLGKKEKKEVKVDVLGVKKTEILFYEDSYKKEFSAKVIKIIKDFVVLDKSLFYPEGGGQPGDVGSIDKSKVVEVQKESGVILHKVSNPKDFSVNQKVKGEINWKRRHDLMLAHTGAHVLGAS
ncbi:MAG: alanine--tRNA ligase, partial [Candidatus Diapherotrites archaeon]|nr:alanine--tRNA ligase [Candidatus Diapherotrites archaeon]